MNHSTSIPLPAIPTDANIYRPLPVPPSPPWLYFLGAVFVVAVILANISPFLAVLVSVLAVLVSRYVHYRVGKGEENLVWADVWRPAPPPAPAWQVFAHDIAGRWLSTSPPKGFEGKCRLDRIVADGYGWHLYVSGEGGALAAASETFARLLRTPCLTVESQNASEVVWRYPNPSEPAEVKAIRDVLLTAGLQSASRGVIEILDGTLGAPRIAFTVKSPTLTAAQVSAAEEELLAAAQADFRYLNVTEIVPGKVQLDFQRGAPQTPIDRPLPEPARRDVDMSRYGIDENGRTVHFDFSAAMHTVLAGVTRSGKSVTAYSLLAEASLDARVKVCGVDPSGILLAPHRTEGDFMTCHLGTDNPSGAVEVVERLVRIMDSRIKVLLDRGFDKVPIEWFTPRDPILLVVLEEYAGTLEWLKGVDQALKPAERLLPRMTGAVGRLLREGAKAGIRVLTIVQRPEAAVLHDRAQYARRISHRIDNADSMRMLFEGAEPEVLDRLKSADPGVGLLDEAGEPLRFFRAYDLDYQNYRRVVLAAT